MAGLVAAEVVSEGFGGSDRRAGSFGAGLRLVAAGVGHGRAALLEAFGVVGIEVTR